MRVVEPHRWELVVPLPDPDHAAIIARLRLGRLHSIYGYNKRKCRCPICHKMKYDATLFYRTRRREETGLNEAGEFVHPGGPHAPRIDVSDRIDELCVVLGTAR